MKRLYNIIAQVILAGGQIVNLLGILWPNHKEKMAVILGILQVLLSAIAHEYNPDGSRAKESYIPPEGIFKRIIG